MRKLLLIIAILLMATLSACGKVDVPEAVQEAVEQTSAGAEIIAAQEITTDTTYELSDQTLVSHTMSLNDTPVVYTVWCVVYETTSGDRGSLIFNETNRTIDPSPAIQLFEAYECADVFNFDK